MWLYHDAAISGINETVAVERQKYAEQAQMVAAKAQKEVARIEQYHYEKLQSRLAAVPDPERVYVRANCPKLPATGDTGVDSGAGAELDADHRRLVLQLRKGAVRLEEKLAACQSILKSPR
jgi:hypothetical protein